MLRDLPFALTGGVRAVLADERPRWLPGVLAWAAAAEFTIVPDPTADAPVEPTSFCHARYLAWHS